MTPSSISSMALLSAAILVYSAQVLIVVAMASLAVSLVRVALPAARLQYWRAVALLCLALPAVGRAAPEGQEASVTFGFTPAIAASIDVPPMPSVESVASLLPWLPWLVGAGIVLRVALLAAGLARLRRFRRRSTEVTLEPALAALRLQLAPRSEVRGTDALSQPVTFGWRRPIVLVPPRFGALQAEAQKAVLCHELLHVARRDWPWIVTEEVLRAVFWFHPAMWWVLEQLHLSREQVVDHMVVARTSSRRVYMDALMGFADATGATSPAIAFLRRRHLASRLHQLSKEPHMSRFRLACAAGALLIVMTGTTGAVLSALPLEVAGLTVQSSSTMLEIRLAEVQAGAGLRDAVIEGSDRHIYLRPETVATGADVASARVVDAGGGRFSVGVVFSAAGSSRMAAATQAHLGKPVAIILDGRVIAAPTLRSPISGSAVISGNFTRAEADAIAAGLTARPAVRPAAAALPRQQPFSGKDPGIVLPVLATEVKPQYSPAAMQAKIQGVVELSAVVRADGTVGDVSVVESLDTTHGLDDAAVSSVRQWTFTPGTKDGSPVDVEVHIQIKFTLS